MKVTPWYEVSCKKQFNLSSLMSIAKYKKDIGKKYYLPTTTTGTAPKTTTTRTKITQCYSIFKLVGSIFIAYGSSFSFKNDGVAMQQQQQVI